MEKERKEEEKKKKKEEEKRKEEENPGLKLWYGIFWNSCLDYLYGITINLFLSKLCRKNPIINVVGWYEMSFMVYFEFWFGRKFPVKMIKSGYFCFYSTPLRLGVGVHA